MSVRWNQDGEEFLQQEETVDSSDDPQNFPEVLLPLLSSMTVSTMNSKNLQGHVRIRHVGIRQLLSSQAGQGACFSK